MLGAVYKAFGQHGRRQDDPTQRVKSFKLQVEFNGKAQCKPYLTNQSTTQTNSQNVVTHPRTTSDGGRILGPSLTFFFVVPTVLTPPSPSPSPLLVLEPRCSLPSARRDTTAVRTGNGGGGAAPAAPAAAGVPSAVGPLPSGPGWVAATAADCDARTGNAGPADAATVMVRSLGMILVNVLSSGSNKSSSSIKPDAYTECTRTCNRTRYRTNVSRSNRNCARTLQKPE